MTRYCAILLTAALAVTSLAGDPPDDQQLIQRSPGQPSAAPSSATSAVQPPATAANGDELSQAERTARSEANTALARLELVLARKAVRAEDWPTAARKALRAQVLLRQVPPEIDTSELGLQIDGILARAAKAGVKIEALARDAAAEAPLPEGEAQMDRQTQAAAKIARQYNGSDRPDIDNSGDARALRERAVRRQATDNFGYRPGREIIDVDSILAQDEQRLPYQGALSEAYRSDEARALVEAHEARIIPDGVVSYPNDWPQRVERRKKWAGGQIARSPSWYDKDGREWYVAIYDIHDLIYVPPDFGLYGEFGTLGPYGEGLMTQGDRIALRNRSMIFGGSAQDLAEGIPLLRYFGGLDPWIDRGPKYSADKEQEVIDMIKAFTGGRVDVPGNPPDGALPPAPR